MNFENEEVSIAGLPALENFTFQQLDKRYLTVQKISFSIITGILCITAIFLIVLIPKLQSPVLIGISGVFILLLAALLWFSTTISFKHSGYGLREKDILYKRGWLIRKTSVVPLKRIQHVSVQSGPLERKYGLASISIYTAGSNLADFTIKGMTSERAQQIKEWITKQLDAEGN